MSDERVAVACRDCEYTASFSSLGRARTALAAHETETGHDIDWDIDHAAEGVERAGADAGVCGSPDCANADSPLLDWRESTDE
ncbi:uncharacterized protein NP_4604A [Natronomonas pharaonis DSM 2160]|uniref:Uncharacterized protein n=1 Tax=Natronomonas pharaonis (strain ATCC 35678 / DSM 2160 / CIP 103997 / JCM 8858 / NBRC 14720 / NCIMB 2260 / Gabara) TaxID=348780 RepID=A0A1U7EYS9_NATPD|nr:hypothetical protein [Natronomonas pharaonis]CAI50393.1 uncharacterized protein NP_4604A [Natronomonas pharaonis DSM 2160]